MRPFDARSYSGSVKGARVRAFRSIHGRGHIMRGRHLFLAWALALGIAPASASAAADVSVGVSLPGFQIGINVPAYPDLEPVPGYPVYYAPGLPANYFFYDGLYWVYVNDAWYASTWYNGPWYPVQPAAVPIFILRVPVRYYRAPPPFFRSWMPAEPPRWGAHWGPRWEARHRHWDHWDHRHAPPRAPLPVYQRQYRGDRYPSREQQHAIRERHYRFEPHDPHVRERLRTESRGDAWRGRRGGETSHGQQTTPRQERTQQREAHDRAVQEQVREHQARMHQQQAQQLRLQQQQREQRAREKAQEARARDEARAHHMRQQQQREQRAREHEQQAQQQRRQQQQRAEQVRAREQQAQPSTGSSNNSKWRVRLVSSTSSKCVSRNSTHSSTSVRNSRPNAVPPSKRVRKGRTRPTNATIAGATRTTAVDAGFSQPTARLPTSNSAPMDTS